MHAGKKGLRHAIFFPAILLMATILAGCGSLVSRDLVAKYAILGTVTNTTTGLGLEGVTLKLTNHVEGPFYLNTSDKLATTSTDGQGKYSNNSFAGDVILEPVKPGWSFTPAYLKVTGSTTTANFAATPIAGQMYTVSGKVSDSIGNGIAGVTLSFGGGYSSVSTGSDGSWIKSGLTGSITVTPTKTGWTFSPANRQVAAAGSNVNFTGTPAPPATYLCSGKVTGPGGTGLGGVVISLGNAGSTTTSATGEWSMSGLSGTVTVTPSKNGYIFSPTFQVVSATTTNVDFIASVVPQPYSINGRVTTADGSGLTGVSISFSSGASLATTDTSGYWSKSGLTGSVTVTPTKDGWLFAPANRQVTDTASSVDFVAEQQKVDVTIDPRWNTPPNAPTSVAITRKDGGVLLTWQAPGANIAGYSIYRATSADVSVAHMRNTGVVTNTSFTDSWVESGQTYWYWVVAVSSSGLTSSLSQSKSISIP